MNIKRKGIYLADLGERIESSVECGIRPVVVLQNDKGNSNSTTVIVAPITTKLKKSHMPTHVTITIHSPVVYVKWLTPGRAPDC